MKDNIIEYKRVVVKDFVWKNDVQGVLWYCY